MVFVFLPILGGHRRRSMHVIRRIRVSLLAATVTDDVQHSVCRARDDRTDAAATVKKPHVTKIHSDTLVDNYFWLREKTNPDVIAHLEARTLHRRDDGGHAAAAAEALRRDAPVT